MPAPKELPAQFYVDAMRLLGLTFRDDGPDRAYYRWHMTGTGCGVMYASHLPGPWGVYWKNAWDGSAIAWTKEFTNVLELLDALARLH